MKKMISILLSVCMALLFCACGSEDTIVGAWLAEDGGSFLGLNLHEPISYDVYYIFHEDGTGTMLNVLPEEYSERSMAADFTYTTNNDGTFVMDIGTAHSEGTYEIDGDTLHLDTTRMGKISITRIDMEDVPVMK